MPDSARPGLPTPEQVAQLPAAVRRAAPADWEDMNGHVNIAAYYGFHVEALNAALTALGWDEDYLRRTGNSFFSVEQHLRFYDEALVGHDLSAHVRWLDRNDRFYHAISVVVNHTTGRVANTFEIVEGHVSLGSRGLTPFSAELAAPFDAALARDRELAWQVPLNAGMGLRH